MEDIGVFTSPGNKQAPVNRLSPPGQADPQKPQIKVGLLDDAGDITSTLTFEGQP